LPRRHQAHRRLYDIEKEGRGQPTDERVRLRHARAKPILDDLGSWLQAQLPKISGKSELAKAIRYGLASSGKLRPYLDHGCLEADNIGAERALEPVALDRKNFSSSALQVAASRRRSPTP
jgi:hypothetical protein